VQAGLVANGGCVGRRVGCVQAGLCANGGW